MQSRPFLSCLPCPLRTEAATTLAYLFPQGVGQLPEFYLWGIGLIVSMFRFRVWRTKGELDIMTLILNPLHPVFVAEATGLDLTRPISRADACEINAAMNRYGVLVWRGQPLTAQQQIQFATAFGPLDIGLKRAFRRPEPGWVSTIGQTAGVISFFCSSV